jgi:FkbM family methyltransferase
MNTAATVGLHYRCSLTTSTSHRIESKQPQSYYEKKSRGNIFRMAQDVTSSGCEIAKIPLLPSRIGHRLIHGLALLRRHLMMKKLKGIIHVGANVGQERDDYASYGLNVLWIEPIPQVFEKLKSAIRSYPNQQALEYLVLDKDDDIIKLHISNNEGQSSSVMDLALHQDVWPSVHFTRDLEIQTHKLATIIDREHINLDDYDGLVLDTQGSELLVLKGAQRMLRNVRMVKAEVADFEAYTGCPRPEQIADFLAAYGFREWMRTPFAGHSGGGRYYDIIYRKEK